MPQRCTRRTANRTAVGCRAVALGLMLWLLPAARTAAQQSGVQDIPEAQIEALQQDLAAYNAKHESLVARRRHLKSIVRQGQALCDASPQAPNRFVVLGLMFESQKRLLAIDGSSQNRRKLFEISATLISAPDRYAEARLEADLMLVEKRLSETNATLQQRAAALEQLIARYRNTTAEARSLLLGALIARKLDAPQLEDAIQYALDENFSDDAEVIEFRRKHLRISRLDVTFAGTFQRADGVTLRFPADTAGHLCLMVFWSKDKPATDAYLEQVAQAVKSRPEPIDVFSFNLDDLPDAGQSILQARGLNWTVMHLPGGPHHQAYRTYANGDPVALLVNEYGMAVIRPEIVHGRSFAFDEARISEARYTAQLQSVFIGDFLLADPAALTPAPMRYRLAPEQALAMYRELEKRCREAIKEQAGRPDVWRLRDRRMVALLGIWNLALDPGALAKAVAEAEVALGTERPPAAQVVPRFCLAKDQLRRGERDPESVVSDFIGHFGGDDAPAPSLAAACVLAIDAKSRHLHETYRALFLERYGDEPQYYALTSLLRDRHHRYRLLQANHNRRERYPRGYIVNHGSTPMREAFPQITLKTLDGSDLVLPRDHHDKLTLVLFVEPPPDEQADFPARLDRHGKPTTDDPVRRVMSYAKDLAAQHIHGEVEVVVAFVSDDASRVAELMKKNQWTGQAVMVPGGLSNPMVVRLGILSADQVPNIFLLRRDGTVAWRCSGLRYRPEFGFPFAYLLGMKVHIEVCEVERGYAALAKGDYNQAARIFAGPFKPVRPDRFGWRGPRYHGQALAQLGLKKYDEALEAIEVAIDAHKVRHYRGRGPRDVAEWRKLVTDFEVKPPCDVLSLLWAVKADILEKLGRRTLADEARHRAEQPVQADPPDVYHAFHEKLSKLRLNK